MNSLALAGWPVVRSDLLAPLPSSLTMVRPSIKNMSLGFITPDDGGDDVFAHVKENPDMEGASAGDAVKYDTKYDDRKGKYNATNVSREGAGGGGGGGKGW